MMGTAEEIVAAAVTAVTAPGYPTAPGQCAHWVRMVLDTVPGAAHWQAGPCAREVFENLVALGYEDVTEVGPLPGDLYFHVPGDASAFGHVGIRVYGNMIAENSSAHVTDGDARGYRSVAEFIATGPTRSVRVYKG